MKTPQERLAELDQSLAAINRDQARNDIARENLMANLQDLRTEVAGLGISPAELESTIEFTSELLAVKLVKLEKALANE